MDVDGAIRYEPILRSDATCLILVHAGAGFHSIDNEYLHLQVVREACNAGMAALKGGHSAADACELAIMSMENNDITNAGYGSNLTVDGTVECDACIVDHFGRSGAVGAISQVKNPIQVARKVLSHSCVPLPLKRVPPILLVNQGATDFAYSQGIPLLPTDYLVSPAAREKWFKWRGDLKKAEEKQVRKSSHSRKRRASTPISPTPISPISRTTISSDVINDTVGVIAVDCYGNIACAASSGGISMKFPGRVGPAALNGVSCAVCPVHPGDVDQTCTATVTSGTGEHLATTMAARTCAERLYDGKVRVNGRLIDTADDIIALPSFVDNEFMAHPGVRHSPSSGAIGILGAKKTVDGIEMFFCHNTDSFVMGHMTNTYAHPQCTMSRIATPGKTASGGKRFPAFKPRVQHRRHS